MGQVMQGLKILIIEDVEEVVHEYLKELSDLSPYARILAATCFSEALAILRDHPDISVIAVDGCFPAEPGGNPDPPDGQPCAGELFVRTVLEMEYKGIILACSSAPDMNDRMIALVSGDPQRSVPRAELGGKGHSLLAAVRRHACPTPAP